MNGPLMDRLGDGSDAWHGRDEAVAALEERIRTLERENDRYAQIESKALTEAMARIDAGMALAERVKKTRTAWLEQYGVPISQEFVDFAVAIGELLVALSPRPQTQRGTR